MKKTLLVTIIAIVVALSLPLFAQEFPDVPPDHWAYDAVNELVNVGVIQGYPDGTYGGKRAMTRYEFAEAVAKAIPAIKEQLIQPGGGIAGPAGPAGKDGAGAEEIAAIRKLVDEFTNELAALGVDVEALRRDVAALSERVTALEEEVARVRFTGEVNMIALGAISNSDATPYDKDNRSLGGVDTLLANSAVLLDLNLGIKAKVSDDISVTGLLNYGDYLRSLVGAGTDITLLQLYADAPVKLGPLGAAQLKAGRFPFQLTPLTLKLVDPDSYTNVTLTDSGGFPVDGASIALNLGKATVTAFAGKTDDQIADALSPDLGNLDVSGIAGVRAVIGTSFAGNVGLTYYQSALLDGRMKIFGADVNTNIGDLGLGAEYALSEPSDGSDLNESTGRDDNNAAWNAKLNWQSGKLGLGAGYSTIESAYNAAGAWSVLGRAVNLVNVKGPSVNLTYALSPNLSFAADGQFLTPADDTFGVRARTTTDQGYALQIDAGDLDKVTGWKAGLKYALTSANTVDLGYEQVTWAPTAAAGTIDTEERYITLGVGHTFNPNSSLKLLYQIVEFDAPGSVDDARGARAAAQYQLKF